MKTNLSKLFGSDEKLEKEGKKFELGGGISFTLKRFGGFNGKNVSKIAAELSKPYAYQISQKIMDEDKQEEINLKSFFLSCVVRWDGIKYEDESEVEYNFENFQKMIQKNPDLIGKLIGLAENIDSYKEELGNS